MRRLLPDPTGELDELALAEAYRRSGPAVRVNFVVSLDGAITRDGRSGGLGSTGDLRVFRTLRALADVVLVGAGTAAAEGYRPVLFDSEVGQLRARLGVEPVLPIAVVSRRASLDPGDQLVRDAVVPTLLVTCASADVGKRAALTGAGVEVLVCGDDDVDLTAAVAALVERGLTQVLCEGGPALLSAALEAGLVDELDLTTAPTLVGGNEARLLPAAAPKGLEPRLVQLLEEDGYLFSRYALR